MTFHCKYCMLIAGGAQMNSVAKI